MNLLGINEIKKYFFPVQTEQRANGMVVTYYWEISIAVANGRFYGFAEERNSFCVKIGWNDLNVSVE